MRRLEKRSITTDMWVETEAKCDKCGIDEKDAPWGQLIPVTISINPGEEGGSVDEYDYCEDCLVDLADILKAAGSKAELVGGSEE